VDPPFNERFLLRQANLLVNHWLHHDHPGYEPLGVPESTRRALRSLRLMPPTTAMPLCIRAAKLSHTLDAMMTTVSPSPHAVISRLDAGCNSAWRLAFDALVEGGHVVIVGRDRRGERCRSVSLYSAPEPYRPWNANVPGWWEVMVKPEREVNSIGTVLPRDWTPPPNPGYGTHPALRDYASYWPKEVSS
jgi:hypothetical protein